ncbi:MAG: heavy metal-binding domain-containing protein [Metamycoplasmataceae bacterium]
MIITTTENIPGKKYQIIGFINANRTMSIFSKTEIEKAHNKLKENAREIGADAVVSVRIFTTPNGSTSIYGTAVKYI